MLILGNNSVIPIMWQVDSVQYPRTTLSNKISFIWRHLKNVMRGKGIFVLDLTCQGSQLSFRFCPSSKTVAIKRSRKFAKKIYRIRITALKSWLRKVCFFPLKGFFLGISFFKHASPKINQNATVLVPSDCA